MFTWILNWLEWKADTCHILLLNQVTVASRKTIFKTNLIISNDFTLIIPCPLIHASSSICLSFITQVHWVLCCSCRAARIAFMMDNVQSFSWVLIKSLFNYMRRKWISVCVMKCSFDTERKARPDEALLWHWKQGPSQCHSWLRLLNKSPFQGLQMKNVICWIFTRSRTFIYTHKHLPLYTILFTYILCHLMFCKNVSSYMQCDLGHRITQAFTSLDTIHRPQFS